MISRTWKPIFAALAVAMLLAFVSAAPALASDVRRHASFVVSKNLTPANDAIETIDVEQNHGAVVAAVPLGGRGALSYRLAISNPRAIAPSDVRCVVTDLTSEKIELTCPEATGFVPSDQLLDGRKLVFDIPRAGFPFPVHVNRAFIVYKEAACRGVEDEELARCVPCPVQNIYSRLQVKEVPGAPRDAVIR